MNRSYIPLLLLVSACTQHLPARTQVQANIGLRLASGCDEVKNVVAHVLDEKRAMDSVLQPVPITDGSTASAAGSTPSISQTQRQVEQVDEADLAKTDGSYIYSLSSSGIGIAHHEGTGEITKVAALNFKSTPEGLYLTDDHRLIAMGQVKDQVEVRSYDLTEPGSPTLVHTQTFAGYYKASRLYRRQLRIVTQMGDLYAYPHDQKATQNALTAYLNLDAEKNCRGYYLANAEVGEGVITLATMDTNLDHFQRQFIFGDTSSSDVYDTGEALFIFQRHWDNWNDARTNETPLRYVYLHEFKFLDDGTPVYQSSLGINGHLLNQYAVDSYQDTLRLALTQSDGNRLAILQKNSSRWQIKGQTEVLARGEQIYAARFMGPAAYLVTYRQMDPLFVIDLQDSSNPHAVGELHLPGVSTFLLPVAEKTLLGIGYGERGNTKLSLFDVSNPAQPRLSSEWEDSGWNYSSVGYDFKAISWQPSLQRLTFPQIAYTQGATIYRAPVFQVSADHGIQLQRTITSSIPDADTQYSYYNYFRRLLLIDQTIVFDFDGRMQSYDLASPNELGSDLTFFSSAP
ncbi:MAG: beta-propeller domain-containing protein [Bdellovibrionales bacterium]|nr:beta-propeller domain-containing protein [Bdellovibrionales bacterium]